MTEFLIAQCIRHQSRLRDDAARGPSSTFAQKEENIISAGHENRFRASFKHFFNIGTVILEVNLINKDATYTT